MDDDRNMIEIEHALAALGPRLAFPATPDLASLVRAELADAARAPRRWMPSWRPALALATALVAVAIGVMTFSPATREAVADWIGLDGVRITFGDEPKAPLLADDLALGDRVALEEAGARVGFEVEVLGGLGDPDEVYVRDDRPGGRVALVYKAREGLPRTAETGVGALFSQFEAIYDREIAEKKLVGAATRLERVLVDGAEGYWFGGGPHVIAYLDAEGEVRADEVRLAGNTLLWQRDGLVFRLETALSKNEAIGLAESAR